MQQIRFLINQYQFSIGSAVGGQTIFQKFIDSPENQWSFNSTLNLKFKISEKKDQNWSSNSSDLLG